MRPVAYPFDVGMFDENEVKVIHVPGVVAFISNQMLPETPLPATGKISVAFRQHRQRVDPKGVRPTFFRNLIPDTNGTYLSPKVGWVSVFCVTHQPLRSNTTHFL